MKKTISMALAFLLVFSLSMPLLSSPADALASASDWGNFFLDTNRPEEALSSIGSRIAYPEPCDYLKELRLSYINAPEGDSVPGYTSTKASKVNLLILDGSPVLVLAEHGLFSCVVDISQSRAGWVMTKHLDDNYYGQQDPFCSDLRKELESWQDIDQVCLAGDAIVGIKTNGKTVTARYGEFGVDVSNWGNLKKIYNCGYSVFAVTERGKIRFVSTECFYPREISHVSETNGAKMSDCRYLHDFTDVLGSQEYGMMCLSDGKLNMMSVLGEVIESPYGFRGDVLYYDAGLKTWCYLKYDYETQGQTLYTQKSDGSFNWSAGKEVTGQQKYKYSSLFQNITEVKGKYPDEAFTALKKDGSLIFYGIMASDIVGYEPIDGDYGFLQNYQNIASLVSQSVFITKEGRLLHLENGNAPDVLNGRDAKYGGLHPEVFGEWENVVSAFHRYSLFAVTADGRVLLDRSDEDPYAEDLGQYDVSSWENVKSVFSANSRFQEYAFTLGVTKDGRILIAGVLPGEKA